MTRKSTETWTLFAMLSPLFEPNIVVEFQRFYILLVSFRLIGAEIVVTYAASFAPTTINKSLRIETVVRIGR